MQQTMHDVLPTNIRGLKRVEYDALVRTGVLGDVPLELLDGQLVMKMAPSPEHAGLTRRLAAILYRAIADDLDVSVGMPFVADDYSEPEPDLLIIPRGGLQSHPDRALLVIEVCKTTHHNDRVIKMRLYANADIPEYWIVDVDNCSIEVYTQPRHDGYGQQRIVTSGVLTPTELPNAHVDLAALFA